MIPREIQVELSHSERAVLLKNVYVSDEVKDQLEANATSREVKAITFTGGDIHLISGDLNYAIVKRGRRGDALIDLSERFDYIDDTSDGSLAGWHGEAPDDWY